MPWSSSPRFSNGDMMYGLLISQVLSGDGKVSAKLALASAQSAMTQPAPTMGKSKYLTTLSDRLLFISRLSSALHRMDLERRRELFGFLGIEHRAVEERLRRV